jgi:hypothetical protein
MRYRCEATSNPGFVQQVAVSYVSNGYFFYVAGSVPEGKDPRAIDEKIIARYDIGISKWAKARRKSLGQANLQYIRFERFFLILATHGQHRFFQDEEKVIRDVRRVPIRFAGHSISHRNGHACVRIEANEYRLLKDYFLTHATSRKPDWFLAELRDLPYVAYAPIRGQLLAMLRAINRKRGLAGLAPVPWSCLSMRRAPYLPFENKVKVEGAGRDPER